MMCSVVVTALTPALYPSLTWASQVARQSPRCAAPQPRPPPRHALTATPTVRAGQGRDTTEPGPAFRHMMPLTSWSPHPAPGSLTMLMSPAMFPGPGSSLVLITSGVAVVCWAGVITRPEVNIGASVKDLNFLRYNREMNN